MLKANLSRKNKFGYQLAVNSYPSFKLPLALASGKDLERRAALAEFLLTKFLLASAKSCAKSKRMIDIYLISAKAN